MIFCINCDRSDTCVNKDVGCCGYASYEETSEKSEKSEDEE